MPRLYWEDRGRDHLYSLDWTAGALVTVLSVATLLGCMAWTRRRAGAPPSTRAATAVMVAGVATLGVTLVFTFGVARSLALEGMFGRRSSDLIERFAWPMMLQVWSSATAGLAVSGLGFRAARRGVSGSLAVGYLCLAGAANIALGYGVWLRPGDGMAVVDIQRPKAQLLGTNSDGSTTPPTTRPRPRRRSRAGRWSALGRGTPTGACRSRRERFAARCRPRGGS